MVKFILALRFKQFYRAISEVGFIRVVIVIPFVAMIVLGLMEGLLRRGLWEALVILGMILSSLHFNRKDKHFLKVLEGKRFLVYFFEYLLASLPFLCWFAYESAWLQIAACLGVVATLPFFNWTFIYQNAKAWLRFPVFMSADFEWMMGVRKNIGYIIPLYIAGLVLSYMTVSVLAVLLLLAMITTTFYLEPGEARAFLHLYAKSPKALMRLKIVRAVGLYLLFTIPLSIAFLIFHNQYWYLLLVVLAIGSVIQLTSVTLRYVTYTPKESNQRNAILLGYLLVCWLTPFLQPVPLLMTITYYKKAINRLRNYY